ncbi:uncharacterized protein LOC109532272 [Hippocampus comes]|uniref:uncharacterized protein LOC109532272 n=1 Tax=Hippocampus comes TaxID=109280 RepID=UPI00094ECA27|nr:PREDICTED: uncharacterized protein LOC109532272 [Hippocampus comes]
MWKTNMKASIAFVVVAVWLLKVNADVSFMQLSEKQSLELSCPSQKDHGDLTSLHVYHRRGPAQTTLLSLARGGDDELRLDPDYKTRLLVSAGSNGTRVKVILSHLEQRDSGLYVCEKRDNGSERVFITQLFLLVDASGMPCRCSSSYPPLLMTIFSATGLILIILLWLAVGERVKARRPPATGPPAVPVYEEMTRKQQNSGVPPNKQDALDEVTSPLYANTLVRQTQDNDYACPRHIALRA